MKVLPISTPLVMNKWSGLFGFCFFSKHNIIKYKTLFNIHFLKQWMKFMGRQILILCINIIWVKNGGDTYMWRNNIFNVDVVCFNANTINDSWGGEWTFPSKNYSSICLYHLLLLILQLVILCLPNVCIIIVEAIYNFFSH